MSQLDLACDAEISTRHLSFVETGRSAPSREMLLRLADRLDVPLRDRNTLFLAAGFAPVFPARPLEDPALRPAREAIAALLRAHEPFPALAIDRHWTMVLANRSVGKLTEGAAPWLLQAPVNALRLSLHPEGLAPRIVNLAEWRDHLLSRVRREAAASADPVLADLAAELAGYPCGPSSPASPHAPPPIAIPLRLRTPLGTVSLLSTTMVFGTPLDITLSDLAIETFLPADAATGGDVAAAGWAIMTNPSIRPATPADLPRIHAVRHGTAENRLSDPALVTDTEVAWYMNTAIFLVSEDAAGVQGFTCVNHQTGHVWALFVIDAAQRRGHGTALLDAATARLREAGHRQVTLSTGRGTSAEGFYRSKGWQAMGADMKGEVVYRLWL